MSITILTVIALFPSPVIMLIKLFHMTFFYSSQFSLAQILVMVSFYQFLQWCYFYNITSI